MDNHFDCFLKIFQKLPNVVYFIKRNYITYFSNNIIFYKKLIEIPYLIILVVIFSFFIGMNLEK